MLLHMFLPCFLGGGGDEHEKFSRCTCSFSREFQCNFHVNNYDSSEKKWDAYEYLQRQKIVWVFLCKEYLKKH